MSHYNIQEVKTVRVPRNDWNGSPHFDVVLSFGDLNITREVTVMDESVDIRGFMRDIQNGFGDDVDDLYDPEKRSGQFFERLPDGRRILVAQWHTGDVDRGYPDRVDVVVDGKDVDPETVEIAIAPPEEDEEGSESER